MTPRFKEQFFKTPEDGYKYGFLLGNRYKNTPNISWKFGGDRLPDEAADGISIWRAMAEGITDGIQGEDSFDGEADFSRTTMSYHSYPSSSQWFHQDPWLTFHMWGSYHMGRNEPVAYEQALKDYKLSNPKPSIDSEPAYEDHPVNWQPEEGWFTDFDVRQIAYWSAFAGTAGHTYGAHAVW